MKLDLKKTGILGVLLLGTISLMSCLGSDDELPAPKDAAFVAVINASPNSSALTFYSSGEQINPQSLTYSKVYGYASLDPGMKQFTVRTGTIDLDTISTNLVKNKTYSIFAVGALENLELAAYEDNFTLPSPLKANVRFIQLSPDAPRLKFVIENSEEDLGEYNFKTANKLEISEVSNKNLHLIDAESLDTLFTKRVSFTRGNNYSVFSKGFVNTSNTDQSLDLQVDQIQ